MQVRQRDSNPTALITGASSGIGAAFARQLAARHYNLVLVARRETRLRVLAAELDQRYQITAEVLVADLAVSRDIEQVEKRITNGQSIGMLINNAGFGTFQTFAEAEITEQIDMLWVHVIASVRLTRAALPGMIDRRTGSIINVSSLAAFIPTPRNVTYSATKAYLRSFSEGLALELRGTGIKVQLLVPGFTATEFHDAKAYEGKEIKARVPRGLWMSADEVAAGSLKVLSQPRVLYVPGWRNRLMITLARVGLGSALAKLFMAQFVE